ncbi:hypothetical protein [Nonlabens marinus]|nr:hypothetical protein [Nonlabens marinus]
MTTTINYIDFIPEATDRSFWGVKSYENLDATLERANEWIRRNYSREIVNVETVVLPNIYAKGTANSKEVSQYYTGGHSIQNFQIIRVWYKG